MYLSEMIERLQYLLGQHEDFEVFLDVSAHGLVWIDEIDVDAENTGVIIWPDRDTTRFLDPT